MVEGDECERKGVQMTSYGILLNCFKPTLERSNVKRISMMS